MGEEARNARPDKVYEVRHEHSELYGVTIEEVGLQGCPAEA